MTISDLLQFAANRADAWNILWQLFIAVATALLAIVSASNKPLSKQTSIIICVGFLLFLVGNYKSFHNYHSIRSHIVKMVCNETDQIDNKSWGICQKNSVVFLVKKMGPPEKGEFTLFYFTLGIIVLSGLWYIPYKRRKDK